MLAQDSTMCIGCVPSRLSLLNTLSRICPLMMKVILSKEADAVDVMSAARETPLFWAVQGGHEPCVRTLLHWGAKRDVKNARGQASEPALCLLVASCSLLSSSYCSLAASCCLVALNPAARFLNPACLLDGLHLPGPHRRSVDRCAEGRLGGRC